MKTDRPFRRRALAVALAAAASVILPAAVSFGGATQYYPDMRTVKPQHLQIQNKQQRELLRFSNGIANTGGGPWQMVPLFPAADPSQPQDAIQQIVDPAGNVVEEKAVSSFEFHPEHNHWHIDGVALFEVRLDAPDGPVFGGNSIKTTFCLIDVYKLEGQSRTKDRTFWECNGDRQGVSVGWADKYHQSTEGQDLDITGAPTDRLLFLVSTANFEGVFLEQDISNNSAWVSFYVRRDSKGNPKLELVGHSLCETPALCGEGSGNV